MKTKSNARTALSIDITTFLAMGGQVTYCKPAKNKKSYPATGKQQKYVTTKAPSFRPSNMFDALIG